MEIKNNIFGAIPEKYSKIETSHIVILPVPYDGTSSWIKGSDKGPDAILDASANMELFDIETNFEVYKKGIYTAPPILEKSSPEKMIKAVYNEVLKYIELDKFIVIIGGEHSISIGSIKAFGLHYSNLTVLQIDAHSDLRQKYDGSKYNHACVMARAREITKVVQVGIRSMDKEEMEYVIPSNIFYAHNINSSRSNDWIHNVVKNLTENVYITIDLDAFDPAFLPSTGTPEPGGLSWQQINELLALVNEKRNIIGFDVVELCPNPNAKASDFLAAKLIYRLLSMKFKE
jgi:agmatinase